MKKKNKVWRWIKWLLVLAVLALLAGGFILFSSSTQSATYKEMTTTMGSLTTYYNFDGVVYAKRTQTIAASAPDTVKTVYVAQNAQVEEGDKLYKTEGGETVRAGIDGEITGLYVTPGDVIAAGEMTVQIIDMDDLEVRLNVDEYDVRAIVPGAQAEITVDTDLSGDAPVLILEDDLYQIIFNLMENGIKYNIAGGKLSVKLTRDEENVHLRVSDTGMGIPEEALSHIFERFYRVDKARSRQSGGSGLGLAIVKAIVLRYRGDIRVESVPDQGTAFTVSFPVFDTEVDRP